MHISYHVISYHVILYHIFSLFKIHLFLMITSLWLSHGGITAAPVRSSVAKIPRRRRLLRRICCAGAEWRWPSGSVASQDELRINQEENWGKIGLPSSKVYDYNC